MDPTRAVPRPRQAEAGRTDERADERVAELEAELAAAHRLLDASSDVLIRHGLADEGTYFSPALQTVLGLDPATTTMADLRTRVHPEDRASRVAARLYADAGIASTSTVRMRHADGAYRTLETSMTPVRGENGTVVELYGSYRDVTATAHVRTAHAELESALDAINRSITLVTVDRGVEPPALLVRFANHYVRTRLGLTAEQITGRPFAEVFPAVAAAGYDEKYATVAQTGEPLHLVVEHFSGRTISGSFEVDVTPWGEDGLVVDVDDVTVRVRAEKALLRSEHRLEEAQRLAGIGSWDWDVVENTVTCSAKHLELLGLPLDTKPYSGMVITNIPTHAERKAVFRQLQAVLARGGPFESRYRVRRQDGRIRHLSCTGTVDLAPDGTPLRLCGSVRDVTAEVERELRLTQQALTDPLTDLPNRRGWESRTAGWTGRAAVAVLDLDHFKLWNDTYGHPAGDALLRDCAAAWSARLRPGDVLARTGGEEFAVLLPGCDLESAVTVLDDLRRAMPGGATASAGVTLLDDGDVLTALARADAALYRAKGAGRDQVVRG